MTSSRSELPLEPHSFDSLRTIKPNDRTINSIKSYFEDRKGKLVTSEKGALKITLVEESLSDHEKNLETICHYVMEHPDILDDLDYMTLHTFHQGIVDQKASIDVAVNQLFHSTITHLESTLMSSLSLTNLIHYIYEKKYEITDPRIEQSLIKFLENPTISPKDFASIIDTLGRCRIGLGQFLENPKIFELIEQRFEQFKQPILGLNIPFVLRLTIKGYNYLYHMYSMRNQFNNLIGLDKYIQISSRDTKELNGIITTCAQYFKNFPHWIDSPLAQLRLLHELNLKALFLEIKYKYYWNENINGKWKIKDKSFQLLVALFDGLFFDCGGILNVIEPNPDLDILKSIRKKVPFGDQTLTLVFQDQIDGARRAPRNPLKINVEDLLEAGQYDLTRCFANTPEKKQRVVDWIRAKGVKVTNNEKNLDALVWYGIDLKNIIWKIPFSRIEQLNKYCPDWQEQILNRDEKGLNPVDQMIEEGNIILLNLLENSGFNLFLEKKDLIKCCIEAIKNDLSDKTGFKSEIFSIISNRLDLEDVKEIVQALSLSGTLKGDGLSYLLTGLNEAGYKLEDFRNKQGEFLLTKEVVKHSGSSEHLKMLLERGLIKPSYDLLKLAIEHKAFSNFELLFDPQLLATVPNSEKNELFFNLSKAPKLEKNLESYFQILFPDETSFAKLYVLFRSTNDSKIFNKLRDIERFHNWVENGGSLEVLNQTDADYVTLVYAIESAYTYNPQRCLETLKKKMFDSDKYLPAIFARMEYFSDDELRELFLLASDDQKLEVLKQLNKFCTLYPDKKADVRLLQRLDENWFVTTDKDNNDLVIQLYNFSQWDSVINHPGVWNKVDILLNLATERCSMKFLHILPVIERLSTSTLLKAFQKFPHRNIFNLIPLLESAVLKPTIIRVFREKMKELSIDLSVTNPYRQPFFSGQNSRFLKMIAKLDELSEIVDEGKFLRALNDFQVKYIGNEGIYLPFNLMDQNKSVSLTTNRDHMKISINQFEVPQVSESVDYKLILNLFDQHVPRDYVVKIGETTYDFSSLRASLSKLFLRIEEEGHFTAVPKDPIAKKAYYNDLKMLYRNLILLIQQCDDADKKKMALVDQAIGATFCGTRWPKEAVAHIKILSNRFEPETFSDWIYASAEEMRSSLIPVIMPKVKELLRFQGYNITIGLETHLESQLVYYLKDKRGLHSYDRVDKKDPYVPSFESADINLNEIFDEAYRPFEICQFFLNLINSSTLDSDKRYRIEQWILEHEPPDPASEAVYQIKLQSLTKVAHDIEDSYVNNPSFKIMLLPPSVSDFKAQLDDSFFEDLNWKQIAIQHDLERLEKLSTADYKQHKIKLLVEYVEQGGQYLEEAKKLLNGVPIGLLDFRFIEDWAKFRSLTLEGFKENLTPDRYFNLIKNDSNLIEVFTTWLSQQLPVKRAEKDSLRIGLNFIFSKDKTLLKNVIDALFEGQDLMPLLKNLENIPKEARAYSSVFSGLNYPLSEINLFEDWIYKGKRPERIQELLIISAEEQRKNKILDKYYWLNEFGDRILFTSDRLIPLPTETDQKLTPLFKPEVALMIALNHHIIG